MTNEAKNLDRAQQRLLGTLEQLLELPAVDLRSAMNQAAELVLAALGADKVDAFLYDPTKDVLRAMGTSDTPVGRLQLARGLDVLPIANGGATVRTFETGQSVLHGHVEQLGDEVPGIIHVLGIRSMVAVPLEVAGERRGVLCAQSQRPEYFVDEDLRFLQAVSRWVGTVAHRAELVEASNAAARESGRREAADELILVLAHDLRNYLSPLRSRIEVMRIRSTQEQRPTDVLDAERSLQALDRLAHLVNDLLDVGRLEQGIFTVQSLPLDLMMLARETAQMLSTCDNEIQVSGPSKLAIFGDADRLRQILENLLGNAIKHSPPGKAVLVHIHTEVLQEPARRHAIIEVSDQGPGVAPEVLPHLFERFSRAGRVQGLGLGLYLAHRIAVAHGGSLSVSSLSGKGASFRLLLPIGTRPSEASGLGA